MIGFRQRLSGWIESEDKRCTINRQTKKKRDDSSTPPGIDILVAPWLPLTTLDTRIHRAAPQRRQAKHANPRGLLAPEALKTALRTPPGRSNFAAAARFFSFLAISGPIGAIAAGIGHSGRGQSAASAPAPAAANSPARMRSAHAITCTSLDSRLGSGAISARTWPSRS